MHVDPIIASRTFINDQKDQLNFFIEDKEPGLTMTVEHVSDHGELVLNLKVNREVLEELKIMCTVALLEIDKNQKDDLTAFSNWK